MFPQQVYINLVHIYMCYISYSQSISSYCYVYLIFSSLCILLIHPPVRFTSQQARCRGSISTILILMILTRGRLHKTITRGHHQEFPIHSPGGYRRPLHSGPILSFYKRPNYRSLNKFLFWSVSLSNDPY